MHFISMHAGNQQILTVVIVDRIMCSMNYWPLMRFQIVFETVIKKKDDN